MQPMESRSPSRSQTSTQAAEVNSLPAVSKDGQRLGHHPLAG
jgi:hypothetical protein